MVSVHISVDMEGVAGVAANRQVRRGEHDYESLRKLMTDEAGAAVAGCFDAGADRVVVADSHGDMANLVPDRLDPRASLLIGSPKIPWGMMQGIGEDFDLAMFVGYHAAAGTPNAAFEHTMSSAAFSRVVVNGELWSESHLCAATAGEFGVPVGLIAGDDVVTSQVKTWLPSIRTVATKVSHGRHVVESLHPARACELIREEAGVAVRERQSMQPWKPPAPFSIEAEFNSSVMAEAATMLPGSTRTGARSVSYDAEQIVGVHQALRCWVALARSV